MEAVTDLWLVRHGQSLHHLTEQLQWDDVPLSEEGRLQAERLAVRLGRLGGVSALYSSPMRRAWETARPVGVALALEPIPHQGLREIDFGEAGGLTIEEFARRWPDLVLEWKDPDSLAFRWPGGESREQFHRRVVPAVASLAKAHQGQRIVVIAHTGPLCCYLAHLFTGDAARWREFPLRAASVTRLEVGPAGGRLLFRDDVSHLQVDATAGEDALLRGRSFEEVDDG